MKRLVLMVIHSLATTVFSVLEVLGIPRIPSDEGGEGDG